MNSLQVVNIKCEGCKASIVAALHKAGLTNIKIDIAQQLVSFDGDAETGKNILAKLGYPQADSTGAKLLSKKARSFVSCALGKFKKNS